MTDIGPSMFEPLARLIVGILAGALLLFVVPGATWLAAGLGVAMPRWVVVTAKALTILGGTCLLLLFFLFMALMNK